MASFKRLVRFLPKNDVNSILIGEPIDPERDIGLASRRGEEIKVRVFSGGSALNAGSPTDQVEVVDRLLSPISQEEIGTIRGIGLNYLQHAQEVKMPLPKVPILFMKPATSLTNPYPAQAIIPKAMLADNSADYEAELTVIIGKTCKDVSEEDALDYVLGYTASNDVSSRKAQLEQSQWCFSKGFDASNPMGPVLVSPTLIPDPSKLHIRGYRNGEMVQDSGVDDLIFSVPKLISFLSRGTTLLPGTTIITGTPAGVAMGHGNYVQDGEEISVEISPFIGTLVNRFVTEKDQKPKL